LGAPGVCCPERRPIASIRPVGDHLIHVHCCLGCRRPVWPDAQGNSPSRAPNWPLPRRGDDGAVAQGRARPWLHFTSAQGRLELAERPHESPPGIRSHSQEMGWSAGSLRPSSAAATSIAPSCRFDPLLRAALPHSAGDTTSLLSSLKRGWCLQARRPSDRRRWPRAGLC